MLTQKFILSYTSKIAVQIVQMATSLIVARIVGPGVIGTLAYGLAFASMFSVVTDMGSGIAHVRILSEGQVPENICNTMFAWIKFVLTFLYIIATLAAYAYTKFFVKGGFENVGMEYVILIYILINVIGYLFTIYSTYWVSKTEQAKQDVPQLIQFLLYQLLRLVLALIGFRAIGLALGNLAAIVAVIPLYIYLGRKIQFGSFDKKLIKRYLAISFPLLIILISQTLMTYFDKLYLQSQTNLIMLGNYSASFGLASFIKTIENSLGLLLFPLFSSYISAGNSEMVNSIIAKYERINFSFVLPTVLSMAVFSNEIIRLTYGHKFVYAQNIFSIIIISFFIATVSLPYANILTGLGKFKESSYIWIMALVIYLVLAYALVNKNNFNLGGTGMSLSLALTNMSLLAGYITLVSVTQKKKYVLVTNRKIIGFNIIYFGAGYLLHKTLYAPNIFIELLYGVVIYAAYFIIAMSMKIINYDDMTMVAKVFDFKKMFKYIKTELRK